MYRHSPFWTTRDGDKIRLDKMGAEHLKNLERFLRRKPRTMWIQGASAEAWMDAIHEEKARRNTPAKPMLDIKDFIYNERKGVSTLLLTNGDVVTITLGEGDTHCPYTAFTTLVTKYIMRSQSAIVRQVEAMKTIKPVEPAPTDKSVIFMPDWDAMIKLVAEMEAGD